MNRKISSVHFQYLVPPRRGSSVTPATDYMDPWVTPYSTFLGPNWYVLIGNASTQAGSDMESQINQAGNAIFGNGGGANSNGLQAIAIPQAIYPPLVRSDGALTGLFAEAKLASFVAGVDCYAGPCVAVDGSGFLVGYNLLAISQTGTTVLQRGLGPGEVVIRANPFNWSVTDTIRLEVTFGVAGNTLRCYQNGILRSTDVDAVAGFPASGLYGFCTDGMFVGVLRWNDFSGGVL